MSKKKWIISAPTAKCEICSTEHIEYVVHNSLWQQYARITPANPLKLYRDMCLECLGKRMGRSVSVDDLKPGIPVNTLLLLWYIQNEPGWLSKGGTFPKGNGGNGGKKAA